MDIGGIAYGVFGHGLGEIAFAVGLGLLLQFLAAILGPTPLKVTTALLVLAAIAGAAVVGYVGFQSGSAGILHDAIVNVVSFGLIAVALWLGNTFMKRWFMAMARAARA
jgi:hypothetical protein